MVVKRIDDEQACSLSLSTTEMYGTHTKEGMSVKEEVHQEEHYLLVMHLVTDDKETKGQENKTRRRRQCNDGNATRSPQPGLRNTADGVISPHFSPASSRS